jgi:hypothetical protein
MMVVGGHCNRHIGGPKSALVRRESRREDDNRGQMKGLGEIIDAVVELGAGSCN